MRDILHHEKADSRFDYSSARGNAIADYGDGAHFKLPCNNMMAALRVFLGGE
jgi:hypothetical protein